MEHQLPGHISEDALRAQLEVNLVAPLRLGEEALSVLESGGGMVFIASTLALRPSPTSAVYSAAKAGLLAAMRALAMAGAARSVRANAVCPGVVDTEMVRAPRLAPGEAPPEGAELEKRISDQLSFLGHCTRSADSGRPRRWPRRWCTCSERRGPPGASWSSTEACCCASEAHQEVRDTSYRG